MNLESEIITRLYHYQSFTLEQMILSMNLKWSQGVFHYQSFTQEQMILSMNLKSSPGIFHYQSFSLEQMIESMNLIWSSCVDILLSIFHTGADYSINDYEIISCCSALSIIHTWADDSINEYTWWWFHIHW